MGCLVWILIGAAFWGWTELYKYVMTTDPILIAELGIVSIPLLALALLVHFTYHVGFSDGTVVARNWK